MSTKNLFPKITKPNPTIYAYTLRNDISRRGELKICFTTRGAKKRIEEQIGATRAKYEILLEESAIRSDGTTFTDYEVHKYLRKKGFINSDGEWFKCRVSDVKSAIIAIKNREFYDDNRSLDFKMRPEQEEAVNKTINYFKNFKNDRLNRGKTPRFLWNAKMRFGKTFATYQLAKKMGWKRILILTFKPAVQSAWEEDLKNHIDFKMWQFISKDGLSFKEADKSKPIVCFGSFQDFLGKNPSTGGIKTKNEWVHTINWDCVVFDEYHYGAWRERAKELFENEEGESDLDIKSIKDFDEEILPITTEHFLYLSGTPFRAIASGEFIEEQIFNWTYIDEQRAKEEWRGENNPYKMLPKMVMLTYQMPDEIREIAQGGEFNEFDLNLFFSAKGKGKEARFKYESEVQKWLDLIRGAYTKTSIDNLKMGAKKPPMPFSDSRLLEILMHTFWFLPTVSSCYAMKNLMQKRDNIFWHDYNIVVVAGKEAGMGAKALKPVLEAMGNPLKTKTITLSCGKLTTGVTVKPWSGILMLRNSSSPETYFQAAFRVQSPWVIKNPDKKSPNKTQILKEVCYLFDFAPNRALSQIADYSCRLNIDESNPEKNVAEFIKFLPVLAYDGSSMREIDASGVLDIATSGTTATLLAKRWESALLVNVDNVTLKRLMMNERALNALMAIEGFRNLNRDIEIIINKSETIKKAKREANDKKLPKEKENELKEEEREYKSLRKKTQEKLIKFATRIPVFMYLTDYRERSLKDIITQLEPTLFQRVTGLRVEDFELLVSLGLFNSALMNDAIYKFKRYEDASLEYLGFSRHQEERVGLFDTVLSKDDYNSVNYPIAKDD